MSKQVIGRQSGSATRRRNFANMRGKYTGDVPCTSQASDVESRERGGFGRSKVIEMLMDRWMDGWLDRWINGWVD